jgi:hypothetical protein
LLLVSLHNDTLDLPDCWEDLTLEQTLATVAILMRLFAGAITPDRARIEMLVSYTGYRPSRRPRDPATRETIHYNLLRLSELLTFAFAVDEAQQRITPHFNFKRNPLPKIALDGATYRGKIFDLDITAKTDVTAREFVDAFDLFAALHQTADATLKAECLNQLCAILYPAEDDHRRNLVSGQHTRMRLAPEETKTLILFWFAGIVHYYATHPVYSVLFSAQKAQQGEKIRLGANETALYLMREGYGDPDRMTLNDYFDAQVKALKDTVAHALAQGAKIEKIARETGIALETLNKLN